MVDSFNFSKLPEIYFGTGSIRKAVWLVRRYGKNILLVTGKSSFSNSKWGRRLLDEFDASGIRYDIISISGEPVTTFIDRTAEGFRKMHPDVVVAAGGGSVIDTGKALAAMIPVDGRVWDYLEGNPDQKQHPGTSLPFMALPTTSGTGSEATKNAVLSTTGDNVVKRSLRHDNFIPDVAIIDPELSAGCPPAVTAASGLDAVTQLLEGYLSTRSSPITDALALSGLAAGLGSLRRVYHSGDDISARSDMAYAALLSGIVLANAGLGAIHGFASVLGGHYQIPHGIICGTLLGTVTRTNINKLKAAGENGISWKKYSQAGRKLSGLHAGRDDHYVYFLADELDRLIDELQMPRLGQYGITREDTAGLADETDIKNNPVNLDKDELQAILDSRL